LKACRQDILLLLALAEAVAQTKLAVAVVASLLGSTGTEVRIRRFLDRRGGIEGDNSAVAETGAFAEGCWGWRGVSGWTGFDGLYIYIYVYMEENLQAAREIDKKLKKVAISNI
jgi:hypothetical protein